VSAAFAEALTSERVDEVVVAQAVTATGADAGSMCLVVGDVIRVRCAVGYSTDVLTRFGEFRPEDDLPVAAAVRTGTAVYLPSLDDAGPGFDTIRELSAGAGRRAAAALPLLVDGRAVGAIGLSFTDAQPFDAAQRGFLEAVSRHCAAALERSRLLQDARRAQDRLAFLADASDALGSTLDRNEILDRATALGVPRLADWAAAYLPEGDRLVLASIAHPDPDAVRAAVALAAEEPVAIDSGLPTAVTFRSGRPQLVPRLSDDLVDQLSERRRRLLTSLAVHSGITAPITSHGEIVGVVAFALADPRRTHTPEDVAVAVQLGARIGVALENARLYERQHSVAEELQRAVLPERLPDIDRLELAARYLPASPGVEVGGDWYDAFALPDGRVGLAVGDVAGHGIHAAATMGQLRNALRAYAVDGDRPAVVLSRLNQLLTTDDRDHFATAVYAVYDPITSELTWANAGHPPPARPSRPSGFLGEPAGVVLGVVPGATYEDGHVHLDPDELVLLYTDGLVEQPGEHLDDGMERLRAALVDHASTPVDAVCDGAVDHTLGGRVRGDDICLLALRRT
jgi:GAF domain-containing protein